MSSLPALALLGALGAFSAHAQTSRGGPADTRFPITPGQRATAQQVAEAGVPLSELAPGAPDSYVVKKGDTLWGISGLFLKSPWRWPELWGMNLQEIRNPHLIYPGQELYLEKINGRARLRVGRAGAAAAEEVAPPPPPDDTVRLSPRIRPTPLGPDGIPALSPRVTEPFLADAIVVGLTDIDGAPRIVAAAQEGRVMLARGDRAYARGGLVEGDQSPRFFRIFRNVTPIKDPETAEVLGYEAQLVGRAERVRPGQTRQIVDATGTTRMEVVPATIDLLEAKEEMRAGDRLLPEPPREFLNYLPHAPAMPVAGQVASIYGSAVRYAAQNQVVVINRGTRDGMERGHVLAILRDGGQIVDKTDPERVTLRLPDERNGLMMVFRTFERVSYALVLQITDGVKVGDRVVNPR